MKSGRVIAGCQHQEADIFRADSFEVIASVPTSVGQGNSPLSTRQENALSRNTFGQFSYNPFKSAIFRGLSNVVPVSDHKSGADSVLGQLM